MRLLFDVLAAVVACGVTYYLALPDAARDHAGSATPSSSGLSASSQQRSSAPGVTVAKAAGVAGRTPGAGSGNDEGQSVQDQFPINVLRNEVMQQAFEDMHRRGEDIMKCLEGRRFAGAQKLRFSVEIVSTPVEATTGRWRFVEVVEGEPLSDLFASCAAHALGGGQRLVPPKELHFPAYSGDLSFVYRIPAPSPDVLDAVPDDAASSR